MTENKKDQPATTNRDDKKQGTPTFGNQKQDKPTDQDIRNKKEDDSEEPSGTEEELQSTEEIREQEDMKHPHKQGVPTASDKNKTGI